MAMLTMADAEKWMNDNGYGEKPKGLLEGITDTFAEYVPGGKKSSRVIGGASGMLGNALTAAGVWAKYLNSVNGGEPYALDDDVPDQNSFTGDDILAAGKRLRDYSQHIQNQYGTLPEYQNLDLLERLSNKSRF